MKSVFFVYISKVKASLFVLSLILKVILIQSAEESGHQTIKRNMKTSFQKDFELDFELGVMGGPALTFDLSYSVALFFNLAKRTVSHLLTGSSEFYSV